MIMCAWREGSLSEKQNGLLGFPHGLASSSRTIPSIYLRYLAHTAHTSIIFSRHKANGLAACARNLFPNCPPPLLALGTDHEIGPLPSGRLEKYGREMTLFCTFHSTTISRRRGCCLSPHRTNWREQQRAAEHDPDAEHGPDALTPRETPPLRDASARQRHAVAPGPVAPGRCATIQTEAGDARAHVGRNSRGPRGPS